MALRNNELKIHDRFTLAELRTYVRNERGTMSGSPHDDRVMALAMANQMRQYAFMPEFTLKQDEYWTVNWFRNLLPSVEKPDEEQLQIGQNTVRGTL